MHYRIGLLFLSAGLIAVPFFGCSKSGKKGMGMPPAVVGTAKVVLLENKETRRYTGQVVPKSSNQIIARVSGVITKIGFKDGEFVKQDQLLLQIDPIPLQAAVRSAEATVMEGKAKLAYAKSTYERNAALYERKAVSKDTLESARSNYGVTQASVLAAEAALIRAKDNLKNSTIRAPYDGKMGITNADEGEYIAASTVFAKIIMKDPVRVKFSVSMADLFSLFGSVDEMIRNADVTLELADGRQYPHHGKIEVTDNQVNTQTDAFLVKAGFANPDMLLIPGATVTVTMSQRDGKKIPAVRPSAIMYDGRGAFVYVVTAENKIERRSVVCGNTGSEYQLLISGVKPGETVVVKGTNKTRPGATVAPVPEEK